MKTRVLIFISAVAMLCFNACSKVSDVHSHIMQLTPAMDSLMKTQNLLAGKWNVVTDTVYAGVNTGGNPAVYVGQPGDYFDFATDGHVYIKEGATLDTLTFQLVSGTQINIVSFTAMFKNQIETCLISPITSHSTGIISPLLPLPAGPQQRIVSLSR